MRVLAIVLASGCSFVGPPVGGAPRDGRTDDAALALDGTQPGGDALPGDAPVMPDGGPGAFCYGRAGFQVCLPSAPTGTYQLGSNRKIDTTVINGTNCTYIIGGRCVVAAADISIDGGVTLALVGANPFVLVATGAITLAGDIDASSSPGRDGAGHDLGACNTPTPAATDNGGAGGGAGGSFGGNGGNGGKGKNGATAGGTHGGMIAQPTTLRGGCSGGPGGPGQVVSTADGAAGTGGGAVALYASALQISGNIDASGGGGNGANPAKAGGGGGGSGGLVVLDATTIVLSGRIYANGGGGGAGAGASQAGASGNITVIGNGVTTTASGGGAAGGSMAGNGAAGAAGTTAAGVGADGGDAGGGGGGGGLGYVLSSVGLPNANVSPKDKALP